MSERIPKIARRGLDVRMPIMSKAPKFTFKKEPQETGLMRVGFPYPPTTIKHKRKEVGCIFPPNRDRRKWTIGFMVPSNQSDDRNCTWHWEFLQNVFDEEPAAREWLQANAAKLIKNFSLHQ